MCCFTRLQSKRELEAELRRLSDALEESTVRRENLEAQVREHASETELLRKVRWVETSTGSGNEEKEKIGVGWGWVGWGGVCVCGGEVGWVGGGVGGGVLDPAGL